MLIFQKNIDPDLAWVTAEFQGGSFDPWGGVSVQRTLISVLSIDALLSLVMTIVMNL